MDDPRESDIFKTDIDLVDSSSMEPFGLTLPEEEDSVHPIGPRGFCVKEYEEQMQELKKENFNLKLKIFMMEDKNPNIPEGAEALYKQNIDLKVCCYEASIAGIYFIDFSLPILGCTGKYADGNTRKAGLVDASFDSHGSSG
jgi:Centrosomin N-terminal motif 1